MNIKTVEFCLAMNKMIENVDFGDYDPRDKLKLINTTIVKGNKAGKHHENDVDSEEEDDREYVSNQY